jgi:hypothetical protein
VVFVRYPPARIRYEGDRPAALLKVRIAPSYRLVDLPFGTPTTSARTGRGTWALYPVGAEVVGVHPDGAISGLAADAAAEVARLAAQERQGELDRKAAQTIQHLLTGDFADGAGPLRRLGARTWSIPATAYWLSGPSNDHGHTLQLRAGREVLRLHGHQLVAPEAADQPGTGAPAGRDGQRPRHQRRTGRSHCARRSRRHARPALGQHAASCHGAACVLPASAQHPQAAAHRQSKPILGAGVLS